MNKQLVIIGIVAILVTVGLSGCTGNPTNQISISELKLFPELYVNKTYTFYGEYIHSRGIGENGTSYYTDLVTYQGEFLYLNFSKITKPEVQNGNVYYFTGKLVKHETVAYDPFDYWLEVTKVESP